MYMAFNSNQLCQFDRFRLDLKRKVLWDNHELVQLPPKALELLCELIENRGQVVTKDELMSRVWHDAFVEEGVLTQNIHHLRKAFRDLDLKMDPIQTVPRRGYRFAGDVREVDTGDMLFEHEVVERNYLAEISADSLRDLDVHEAVGSIPETKRRTTWPIALGTVAALVLIAAGAYWSVGKTTTQAANGIQSVAVLPLRTINSKESDQTFSLGLTDALIAKLGRLSGITVRPFSAVAKYETSDKDAVAFARELKADAALEGTIQNAEGRLRANLRLIDTRDGSQIWADSFDEAETDILELQDVISNRVARAIFNHLGPSDAELASASPTKNREAYRFYLAGREAWLRRDGKVASLSFYKKAIELDPNFALPYLGIADEYAFTYGTQIAEENLTKALELDPSLHEAHATRGFLQMFHRWDWAAAEASFKNALELAPRSSKAHHWYGVYLSIRGRLDEAKREMEKALELDPTSTVVMTDLAELHYFSRDYQRAQHELERVIEMDPDFINARANLVKVRFKNGGSYFLEDGAFNIHRQQKLKAQALPSIDLSTIESLLAKRDEEALRQLNLQAARTSVSHAADAHLLLSRYHAMAGEAQISLDELEKAIEKRVFVVPFVAVDPLWDPVRNEPRFQELMRRMNL